MRPQEVVLNFLVSPSSTVLSETMREMPSWIWGRGKNSRGTLQLSKDHSALRQSTHQNFGFSWGEVFSR